MGVLGSKWPKWGRNGRSVFDMYLIYLFEERAIRNCFCIFEGQSNMYVSLQTNIERDEHTS